MKQIYQFKHFWHLSFTNTCKSYAIMSCYHFNNLNDKVIYLFSNKTYQKNIKLILETDSILIFFVTFGKYFILDFLTFKTKYFDYNSCCSYIYNIIYT